MRLNESINESKTRTNKQTIGQEPDRTNGPTDENMNERKIDGTKLRFNENMIERKREPTKNTNERTNEKTIERKQDRTKTLTKSRSTNQRVHETNEIMHERSNERLENTFCKQNAATCIPKHEERNTREKEK